MTPRIFTLSVVARVVEGQLRYALQFEVERYLIQSTESFATTIEAEAMLAHCAHRIANPFNIQARPE